MEVLRAPLNVWNKDSIRPGAVGSVGETLMTVRLKQSCIELPPRYDTTFSQKDEVYFGANISDGSHAGYTTGGGPAKTIMKPFGYRPGFKTVVGWRHQDIKPTDRSRMTVMGDAGQYSWKSKVAGILQAKKTGNLFSPTPGEYALSKGSIPRGGSSPQVVAYSIPNGAPTPLITKFVDPNPAMMGTRIKKEVSMFGR